MPETSAVLALPYIQPSQAQKHVTHNEAIKVLDALVQLVVVSRVQTDPPAVPAQGARFIVPTGGTGAWAGQDGKVAYYDDAAWIFLNPQPGWRAYVSDEALSVTYDDSASWQDSSAESWELAQLGVSATPDGTNRLSVSSPATLLNHAGAGHQLKLNKAAIAETASMLYQTNWSGRVEMGLNGNDDFSIKVSPDGGVWSEAMRVTGTTGVTEFPVGLNVAGSAAYHRGNLLGAVSQSGGTPDGAVIEHGSNANGDYVRFADGMQICTHSADFIYNSSARMNCIWTFPATFAAEPFASAVPNINDFLASAAPDPSETAGVMKGSGAVASAAFWLYRISGMTDFVASDSCTAQLHAVGRWF